MHCADCKKVTKYIEYDNELKFNCPSKQNKQGQVKSCKLQCKTNCSILLTNGNNQVSKCKKCRKNKCCKNHGHILKLNCIIKLKLTMYDICPESIQKTSHP